MMAWMHDILSIRVQCQTIEGRWKGENDDSIGRGGVVDEFKIVQVTIHRPPRMPTLLTLSVVDGHFCLSFFSGRPCIPSLKALRRVSKNPAGHVTDEGATDFTCLNREVGVGYAS